MFLPISGTDGRASLRMFEKQIQEGFAEIAALARPRVTLRLPSIVETYSVGLAIITLSRDVAQPQRLRRGRFLAGCGRARGDCVACRATKRAVDNESRDVCYYLYCLFLFAAVVWGPLAAMVVGTSALLAEFGPPYERWLVWSSTRALAGGSPVSQLESF